MDNCGGNVVRPMSDLPRKLWPDRPQPADCEGEYDVMRF